MEEDRKVEIGWWWEWLSDDRIMYVDYKEDAVLPEDWTLFMMDMATQDRQLLPGGDLWKWVHEPTMSPDLSEVAFSVPSGSYSTKCESIGNCNKFTRVERDSIFVVNLWTLEKRFLVEGVSPAWSPDSQQLAYLEYDSPAIRKWDYENPPAIRVVNADGSDNRMVLESMGEARRPRDFQWWPWDSEVETTVSPISWGKLKRDYFRQNQVE